MVTDSPLIIAAGKNVVLTSAGGGFWVLSGGVYGQDTITVQNSGVLTLESLLRLFWFLCWLHFFGLDC